MTKAATAKLIAVIVMAYPNFDKFKDEDHIRGMAATWADLFSDDDEQIIAMAVKKHIATSKWPPSIAEIREAAASITNPDIGMTEDEAWRYVADAVRYCGPYQPSKAKESMPPDIWRLVQSIGYEELCRATYETSPVLRGQFCRMWRAASERKKQEAALPEGLKEAIAKIGAAPDLKLIGEA